MCGVVDAGEGVEVKMRVALGGGDAAVAEKLLNGTQVGPAFQKMRGKGVPQCVKTVVGDLLLSQKCFETLLIGTCGDWFSFVVDDEFGKTVCFDFC